MSESQLLLLLLDTVVIFINESGSVLMGSAVANKSMAVTQQWQKAIYPLKSFKTAYFIVHMIKYVFLFFAPAKIN